MRRSLLVASLAVGLLFALTSVATAFPTDWKMKPYFDAVNSELRLQTTYPGYSKDCDWKVPAEGVYNTGPDTSVQPLDWTDLGCIPSVLWAKTCKPGRQTVSFTKTIYLPAGAEDLDVSLVSFHDAPLTMSIEINGAVALSTVKSVHKLDLRGKQALFKVGLNKIAVEATKPKTGKPCNVSGTDYGVLMQMRAIFGADINVSKLKRPPAGSFFFQLEVKNDGPSRASTLRVGFDVGTIHLARKKVGDHDVSILITGPGIDLDKCYYYTSSTSCDVAGGLGVGESRSFTVVYRYDAPSGPFFEEWKAVWYAVGDLHDPRPGNSSSTRLQGACRPARPPKCG